MLARRTMLKGLAISALSSFGLKNSSAVAMQGKPVSNKETKIFDPADGFGPISDVFILTDATVAKRDNRWWMYVAGRAHNRESIELFSASLPEHAPLSATGWTLTANETDKSKIADLAGHDASKTWDLKGGRHCPAYVKGWDPVRRTTVERIYYAGGAGQVWGPYTIGYVEWNGTRWVDQATPVFVANEAWEHGSVYEPNLIYHDGKWKMWYVAGSNQEDYIVQGYSESVDGRTNWSKHQVFFSPEEKVFDFCVIQTPVGFEAVFARVFLGKGMPLPTTGLWWCQAKSPSPNIADWSKPVQLMGMSDSPWHLGGPWKPSVQYDEKDPKRMFVFFDGLYPRKDSAAPFPYVFTLGCVELQRPA